MDKSHVLEMFQNNMGTSLSVLSLFWWRVVQPEENLTNNKAQFFLLHAAEIFPTSNDFRVPFLFQYNEVPEEWSSDKAVLIQNKAVLSTSIISDYINCSALPFVQSSRCGRLVNREESKEDASNLWISKKEKSKKRKQPLYNNMMNALLSNLNPLRHIPSPEMTCKPLSLRG